VQVACFDTAFHHDLPRVAQLFPIPRRYEAQGRASLRLSWIVVCVSDGGTGARGWTASGAGRVILAHLGNGASLAAVYEGKSMDTSMGLTPAGGVPMSTRSGDLDPGLVWYLERTEKITAKKFNEMVNFQSGLLGISETSSDMHDLLERETKDVRAAEAVALFCYQVKKWIGAFAAALGGLDTLVFAGGIGENAPNPRPDLRWAGISWNRVRRKTEPSQRRRDFHGGWPGCRPRYAYGRGMDDCKDSLPRSRAWLGR
jgi:acetate kinase